MPLFVSVRVHLRYRSPLATAPATRSVTSADAFELKVRGAFSDDVLAKVSRAVLGIGGFYLNLPKPTFL